MRETTDEELDVLDTEDFGAFTAARDADGSTEQAEAPAESDETTPPSEPADEAGQIAKDSESEEEAEQEDEEETPAAPPVRGKTETRLAKRMRELTGEIKGLKSQLAEATQPDADEEVIAEVVSAPETVAPAASESDAAEPMLKDFEDDEATGQSAWDQYAAAMKAFNKAETAKAIAAALKTQKTEIERDNAAKAAEAAADAAQIEWNKAASRFPNFNEVATDEIKISTAMQSIMRMDPVSGTELVMYFGEHPEEAKAIMQETMAANEKEWPTALAKAGVRLGEIKAALKLKPPAKIAIVPKIADKGAPAPNPKIKTVTSASRPPSQIRGGVAAPKFDTTNEGDAGNYSKWVKQREKELAASGKR